MTHTELVHQEMQRAMAGEEVEVVYPWVSPEKRADIRSRWCKKGQYAFGEQDIRILP